MPGEVSLDFKFDAHRQTTTATTTTTTTTTNQTIETRARPKKKKKKEEGNKEKNQLNLFIYHALQQKNKRMGMSVLNSFE